MNNQSIAERYLNGTEFWSISDQINLFKDGESIPFDQVKTLYLDAIRKDLDADPVASVILDSMFPEDPIMQLRQFLICNYSNMDDQPDITSDGKTHREFVNCSKRGSCPHEGKLCLNYIPALYGNLSKREIEVIKLTADGYEDKQIAALLNIDYSTIESHMKNIRQKTGCPNKPSIVAFAFRKNIIW